MGFEILNQAIMRKFGKPVLLPDGSEIKGIFDDPEIAGKLERMKMDYEQPVLYVLDDTASRLKKKMELIIPHAHKAFRVQKLLPDGEGMTDVLLVEKETSEGPWK